MLLNAMHFKTAHKRKMAKWWRKRRAAEEGGGGSASRGRPTPLQWTVDAIKRKLFWFFFGSK
jgi:hypothetical protein